ncbi:TolB family protein [Amycolatopsis sp. NPDC054798]
MLAAVSATAGPPQAAYPGDNGKIFFTQSGAILSMNPDGTGVATVVGGQDSFIPRVSADGTKVAFERRVGPDVQVFTMNPDGTEITQITSGAYADGQSLTWSPDGTRIAYSSSDGLISTIKPDGTGNAPLVSIPGHTLHHPRWSPDGTQIAFWAFTFSAFNSDPPGAHVYTANADGTNPTNISGANDNDVFPVWSPDSALILFMVDTQGLLVMNADGTNRTQIYASATGIPPSPGDWAAVPGPSPRPLRPQLDNLHREQPARPWR